MLVDVLSRGFRRSKFRLLACGPSWIYPLCNLISACALWSIDVGDYRLSRASSYAATAAAVVELDDEEVATRLLQGL